MDILVSFQFGALIFHLSGNSAEKTVALMAALNAWTRTVGLFDAEILFWWLTLQTEEETAAEIKGLSYLTMTEDPSYSRCAAVHRSSGRVLDQRDCYRVHR